MTRNRLALYFAALAHHGHDMPFASAAECHASAYVTCTIKDTRSEFQEFFDKPCLELASNLKIQRNGSYSGYNIDGYPQIKVEYKYKICNNNDTENKRIRLIRDNTFSMLDGVELEGLNNKGLMKGDGSCRKNTWLTRIDTRNRYHSAVAQVDGFLFKGGKLFDGKDHSLVKCYANEKHTTRWEYDDDCKMEVEAKCYLKETNDPCEGNILRTGDTDCRNVEVQYRFVICNHENEALKMKKDSSMKIDDILFKNIKKSLPSNECYQQTKNDVIKTCDPDNNTKIISVYAKAKGQDCRDASFDSIEVGDAYPSFSPSMSPTTSSKPSTNPTLSHKPSQSSRPSMSPTSVPSEPPTKTPSVGPSAAPTKSMQPSSHPTASPSDFPTSNPSASPSNNPTLSAAPSSNPSASPSVSMMPSCVPSNEPSLSSRPSSYPTTRPSASPTGFPSASPSLSVAPSISQSPSTQPAVVPTTRRLKNNSKKSKKNNSNSKSKKSKKSYNICQD